MQHVVPELERAAGGDDTGAAVLKADAIKFLTTFRGQVPKAACVQLLPHLVQALGSPSNVVHSYAAICLERLLASKVRRPPERGLAWRDSAWSSWYSSAMPWWTQAQVPAVMRWDWCHHCWQVTGP